MSGVDRSDLNLRVIAGVVLVIVAIVGYVIGHRHASAAPARSPTRPAFASSVLLEYPPSWRMASTAPAIPGLSVASPLVYAPGGEASDAGLMTGQLAGGEPSPLPAAFVAHLGGLPTTEVVDLVETEAFKYSGVEDPGFGRSLTVYAIPTPGGAPTALACYAAPGHQAQLRECEHVVSTLRLAGQPQSYNLTPDATYAGRVSEAIAALDRQRVALRAEISRLPTLAGVQHPAAQLADAYATAAGSLSALEPPPAAGQAQAELSSALLKARSAYAALAAAAEAGDGSTYQAAGTQVDEAESAVDAALESFALLGYAHA